VEKQPKVSAMVLMTCMSVSSAEGKQGMPGREAATVKQNEKGAKTT
jgi:hypothetical protein